jgi:glycosyltransferase involved in cell wall biosynthesis
MTSGTSDAPGHTSKRPLSVLHVHNFYRSDVPSGENDTVVLLTRAWAAVGATVTTFYLSSDALVAMPKTALLKIGTRPLGRPNKELRTVLHDLLPDVLIVHNLHPQISPGDLRYAQRIGVPVVHVVHNYRHSCLAGTHFREGRACTSCSMRRFAGPGVRRRCYRASVPQSLVLAASNGIYHALWRDLDAYVAISPQIAEYLVTEGFPPQRIHVISNPVEQVDTPAVAGTGVLYAGRLEREKGIELLLDAWRLLPDGLRSRHVLHVAGQGALYKLVRERSHSDPSIRFHGLLGRPTLAAVARDCGVTVIPSIWDEPFGRVAAEALMRGHALVVTNRGALADIATAGAAWVVEPQARALSEALIEALRANSELREQARVMAMDRYGLVNVGRSYVRLFRSVVAGTDST